MNRTSCVLACVFVAVFLIPATLIAAEAGQESARSEADRFLVGACMHFSQGKTVREG